MNKKIILLTLILILALTFPVAAASNNYILKKNHEENKYQVEVSKTVNLGGKLLIGRGKSLVTDGGAMIEVYYTGYDPANDLIHFLVTVDNYYKKSTMNLQHAGSIWKYKLTVPYRNEETNFQTNFEFTLTQLGGNHTKQLPSINLKITEVDSKLRLHVAEPQNLKLKQ